MISKIEYIKKYNKKIEIIDNDDLNSYAEYIPKKWIDILQEKEFLIKAEKTIELWETVIGRELSNTISYLKNNLTSLDVLFDGKECSLLYGLQSNNKSIAYYEGKFLLDLNKNINVQNSWSKIPQSICRFYEQLHNGFYYYASHSMGLSPENEITYFADYDWEIFENIKEQLPINLNTTFGFFTNGMGGYVAVDTENCLDDNAILWFTDNSPKFGLNFWDFVDEWIVIGFQS